MIPIFVTLKQSRNLFPSGFSRFCPLSQTRGISLRSVPLVMPLVQGGGWAVLLLGVSLLSVVEPGRWGREGGEGGRGGGERGEWGERVGVMQEEREEERRREK